MEMKKQTIHVMLVKLVKGKVSGVQQLTLNNGSTLEPLLEQPKFAINEATSADNCVSYSTDREMVKRSIWRRCICGMTFLIQNKESGGNSNHKCKFCCQIFHNEVCVATHVASAHRNVKKQLSDVISDQTQQECIKVEEAMVCNINKVQVGDQNNFARYHKCRYCGQCFHSFDSLESHVATVHKVIKRCPCNDCTGNHVPPTKDIVKKPEAEPLVECKICHGKVRRNCLRSHLYAHTGRKPHQCPICLRTFSSKAYMLDHKHAHTAVKDILCEFCGQMFNSIMQFKSHLLYKHSGKNVVCELCDRRFTDLGSLKCHLLVHTQEKPHHCNLCDKRFARKDSLKLHLRVHNNDKPHVCTICEKAFCHPSNLKTHMKTHGIFLQRRMKDEKRPK